MFHPTKITIGAEFKNFGLENGKSIASSASIEFSIPEGMQREELLKRSLEEREKLELMLLLAQVVKGAITNDFYKETKASIKAGYEKIKTQVKTIAAATEGGEGVPKDKARVAADIGDTLGQ